jgi:hypothetical protein
MKYRAMAMLCLMLCSACARLPHIQAPVSGTPNGYTPADVSGVYPRGDWQFVHIIEAAPPNRQKYTLTGVVRVSSENRTLHCVLLTLEGLILFEADVGRNVSILRALPPFGKPGFSRGLINDLMLIFLPPEAPPEICGDMPTGAYACRYPEHSGAIRDILMFPGESWEVRRYNSRGGLEKTLKPVDMRADGQPPFLPDQMILKTHGMLGYDLVLTLVESERQASETPIKKAAP